MSGNAVAGGGKGDLSSSSDDDVPVQKKVCIRRQADLSLTGI
jgi:hypothetical protein